MLRNAQRISSACQRAFPITSGQAFMATRLSTASIERAIEHISIFGDTDVFPHPIETAFLIERKKEIAAELSVLDLELFEPAQAIETIAPKSRWGFRIVHQLPLLETLLFTAAAIEIGADIESIKRPINEFGPFGYRFDSAKTEASLFVSNRSYKDWLQWQRELAQQDTFAHVVATDIADFYQRIYFHRIENILEVATERKGVKSFIEKLIKRIRGRQSYGIPVDHYSDAIQYVCATSRKADVRLTRQAQGCAVSQRTRTRWR